jgi:hypothetical protein
LKGQICVEGFFSGSDSVFLRLFGPSPSIYCVSSYLFCSEIKLHACLFNITQPALMQLAWFAKWYPRWKTWKDALMDNIRASAVWQAARRMKAVLRRVLRKTMGGSYDTV